MRFLPPWLVAIGATAGLQAQLITTPASIPDTGKPPVVFLNGYQSDCSGATFDGTFGSADQLLRNDNRVSLFFNSCVLPNKPAIEELGNEFGRFLAGLKYTGGGSVPQVDVVAHSMGGLILRSYITGKQTQRGVFQPPADTHIRKAVFLAVPFFGALASDIPGAPNDVETDELRRGSQFVFDLATWNQNIDDLRGIDAVAVVANGGTGVAAALADGSTPGGGFDDSTVSVTSASLEFAQTGRTRVVPYCHTSLSGIFSVACSGGALPVAKMIDDQHLSARIMRSFLNGTNDWQTVGQSPSTADFLKDRGGIEAQFRNERDQIINLQSAGNLKVRSGEIAWSDNIPGQSPFHVTASTAGGNTLQADLTVSPGFTHAIVVSIGGPRIDAVIPNYAAVTPRAVAPGSFISIYGAGLALNTDTATQPYPQSLGGAEVLVNAQPIAIQYASPTQINAIAPDLAPGLAKLTVRTANAERALNILLESSVFTAFPTATNAVTGALLSAGTPAHPGDYIGIYGTGLGLTEKRADGLDWARTQPSVTAGGLPCTLTYAGRAPGFAGLDQINCRLDGAVPLGDAVPVVITAGSRTATLSVPVR